MCGVLASTPFSQDQIQRLTSTISMFERRTKKAQHTRKSPSETHLKLKRLFGDGPPCVASNRLCETLYWICRRIQFWLCFYDDEVEIDVEDLLSNPFNTQPPSLDELADMTGFNREWIMFLYRNFKQICSNGRMPLQQWRRIFRLIFPNSADNEFADRVFQVIAGDQSRKSITFEDLILCLHAMSKCYCCTEASGSSTQATTSTSLAQFVFSLMRPDDQSQVNLDAFKGYAEAVFKLNAHSLNPSSHGLFGQIHHHSADEATGCGTSIPFQCSPDVKYFASQRFSDLDTDNDGFITVKDVERTLMTPQCCSIRLAKEAHLHF